MNQQTLKSKLYEVIFGTETPAGKRFDMILIYAICISVLAVVLDSVNWISEAYSHYLWLIEWCFTIAFTIEYLVRIYCSPTPFRYMRSFFGVVDFLSILPSYIALFVSGASYLLVIRLFRVLRIFRILRLFRYLSEVNVLMRSMLASRRKILVFFASVLVLSTVFGSLMYLVEGPRHGFTSIPKSIYWTIVTITTVGYGDIVPQTVMGQAIAAMAMLTGYSIIAVPTGIITAELAQEIHKERQSHSCSQCHRYGHEHDALYCRFCGAEMPGH